MPVPILFFGDSPDLQTGLGRIGRDLAVLTSQLPDFRVGYLGRGGTGSRKLPFAQYNFGEDQQWGELQIERAWMDFAGDEKGIIFSIWDASRLHWFARPYALPSNLQRFLTSGRFARWGYFPVDAAGPGSKLTGRSADALKGFDRVLGYGIWGAQILENSLGHPVDWIPHGIDGNVWKPRDRTAARMATRIAGGKLIGCVMSNQTRKDWGLAFTTFSELRKRDPMLRFWCHVDTLERDHSWSIRALVHDFGLSDCINVSLSGTMSDEQLSYWYSACDVTILPSSGEGFGFPLVESMACGTPAIHGNYAGGAELVPREYLVEPSDWRIEGIHNNVRPVFKPEDWADKVMEVLSSTQPDLVAQVEHLFWKNLWLGAWKRWLLEGIHA